MQFLDTANQIVSVALSIESTFSGVVHVVRVRGLQVPTFDYGTASIVGSFKSAGGRPVGFRVNASPNFVIPSTKPP